MPQIAGLTSQFVKGRHTFDLAEVVSKMFPFVFLLIFVIYPLGGNIKKHAGCPKEFIYSPLAYRCFKFYTVKRTWAGALGSCLKTNSTLAILQHELDLLPIRRMAKHYKGQCTNSVNGTDEYWISGKKLQFTDGEYFGWYNGSGYLLEPAPTFRMIPQPVNTTKNLNCLKLQFTDFLNNGFKYDKCVKFRCYLCMFSL